MMSMANSIAQQSQGQQSDSSFQLALASSSGKNSAMIRDCGKKSIVEPTIQQQQLQQNMNIVFTNTIQLQQSQLQAKLQRQSLAANTGNTNPSTARTIQRTHKIQLTQAPPPNIVQAEK